MFWSYCSLCIVLQKSNYTRIPSCPACVLCSSVLGSCLALTISASSFLFCLYITTDSWVVVPSVTFGAQEMWRRCQLDCITELWSWRTDLGWRLRNRPRDGGITCRFLRTQTILLLAFLSCYSALWHFEQCVCVCVGWGACVCCVCWHMCLAYVV